MASAVFAFSQAQAADSWNTEAVFVSLNGNFAEVKTAARDTIVCRNTDPQMAIEWGMVHAKNTIVLAGKYLLSDRIDILHPGATLIISKDAAIELSADTQHTAIPILPSDLPEFDIKASVEVVLKGGEKVFYDKTVTIDLSK